MKILSSKWRRSNLNLQLGYIESSSLLMLPICRLNVIPYSFCLNLLLDNIWTERNEITACVFVLLYNRMYILDFKLSF
jgi:hypothetical protein